MSHAEVVRLHAEGVEYLTALASDAAIAFGWVCSSLKVSSSCVMTKGRSAVFLMKASDALQHLEAHYRCPLGSKYCERAGKARARL
eukprot:6172770-Pleurochrysis_carterae.AAC.1